MIKVVIDTNVVVSAHLVDAGPSAAIFHLATNKNILMCISPAVLAEYERVLHRPRLKLDPARIADALAFIRSTASANYLITGNTDDFSKDHKTTKIITPRDFIDLLVPQLDQGEH